MSQICFCSIDRFRVHFKTGNSYIGKEIISLWKENFTVTEVFTAFDKKALDNVETYFIKKLNTLYPNGYNMKLDGGRGKHVLASKIKNSRALGGDFILAVDPKTRGYKVYKPQRETSIDGLDVRNVNAVLKDKGNRPTHRGWIFKYLSQVNQSGSASNKRLEHAQRLVVDPSIIEKIIEDYNTTTSDRHPNKVRDNAEKILSYYSAGERTFSVAKQLNIDKKSILKFLAKQNFKRTKKKAQQNRRRMMR